MKVKTLEVRDEGTFIPVLCVDMNPDVELTGNTGVNEIQRYLLRRCGYHCDLQPNILMTNLSADGGAAWNDPYGWGGRTRPVAHNYIIENWETLKDGDVVDVSFILGESKKPKVSEREETY